MFTKNNLVRFITLFSILLTFSLVDYAQTPKETEDNAGAKKTPDDLHDELDLNLLKFLGNLDKQEDVSHYTTKVFLMPSSMNSMRSIYFKFMAIN